MGRPRKYATNAEKQAAYRGRKKPTKILIPSVTVGKVGCLAYVPRGTKCKLCGKGH